MESIIPSRRDLLITPAAFVFARMMDSVGFGGSVSLSSSIGVSLAGAEFGSEKIEFCNTQPGILGKDYTYPRKETIAYFAAQGLRLFRLPFRWERLQRRPGQALDKRELSTLRKAVNHVDEAGGRVILDLHNYGRYRLKVNGQPLSIVVGARYQGRTLVPLEALSDFWVRLASVFKDHPAIAGYGLMNEPHDMGDTDWKSLSQDVVTAIRGTDRVTHLLVSGDSWSNAHRWEKVHATKAWIRDPSNRFAYEAHCYFDHDASGKYTLSYDEEKALDSGLTTRGRDRVLPFLNWCQRNRVSGFLGEFGIPKMDARWQVVMDHFLQAVAKHRFPLCYWAAGEWWGDYPLSIQPDPEFRSSAPQMHSLVKLQERLRKP